MSTGVINECKVNIIFSDQVMTLFVNGELML